MIFYFWVNLPFHTHTNADKQLALDTRQLAGHVLNEDNFNLPSYSKFI